MSYFPISRRVQRWQSVLIVLIASSFFSEVGRAQIPSPLNVAMVEADPSRPLVYGLHQSGAGAGTLVVFNMATRTVSHGIPVGDFPSDLAVRADGSALYVLNSGSKSISKIDLSSFSVVKTTSLTQFGTWGSDITVTPGNIGLGPGDVIYYTDGAWGPALHAINFETGQHLQKTQFKSPTDSDGFGDFAISPDGTQLFAWKQYGWSAGVLGTYVARYGISGVGILTYEASGTNERLGAWDRDPLDAPALMDSSGDTLLIKNRVVDQSSPLVFPRSFPEVAYAMSSKGRVVGAVGNLYDATTTDVLSELPDLGKVQCFSKDGSLLVYFNGTTKSFVVEDLVALLGIDVIGLEVSPERYSVGPTPQTFDWFPRDGATSYRIFLGTSEAAVESAGPGSGLIIGQTSNLTLPTPSPLNPGTYFWRVDAITPQGTLKGDVVSFSVSPVSLSMGRVDFGTLVGVQKSTRAISLVKSGATEVAWTASPNHAWLSLISSSGTTPSSLQVVANVAGLNVGLHEGSITVVANGSSVVVPVSVRIEALNYTHLEADGKLPYIYGISQVSESSTSPAHLLRIDAGTGEVLDSVEVGSSVTDLEIHYQENRLYVTNWMTGKLRALDRTTLEEVQAYPFAPFGGTGYGAGDVYRISAGKAGRLVVEEEDQWIDVNLFDTATGAVLDTSYEREGGGIFDPTGRYYYHGDNNSSGSEFHRFDTDGDNFVELTAVRTTGVSSYGSRNVKRSADGARYYWNGTAFDAQLNVLWTINEEIESASLHGDVVFTPGEVRNGATGGIIASLPVSTSIMAIGGNQENLFLASGGNLTVVDLSTLVEIPGPGIQPSLVDGSTVIGVEQTLRWSLDPFTSAYKVYFGTSLAAVQTANETSGEFMGTATGGAFTLPADLALGGQYFWRVDAVGFLGTATGPVWSFEVAPVEVNPSSLSISIPSGLKLTRELEVSAAAPTAWGASVVSPGPLALDATTGITPGIVQVTVDAAGLAVGSHSRSITFTAAGKSFVVPVEIQVLNLNYTLLEADAQLPYVYGITQVSESSTSPAHLLRIDSVSGQVLDAVPVGSSVSDLEIHYAENRIYVTNWMTGKLRALDRTTLEEVQVYPFVPFGGTGSGTGDAYRISAGKAGRLIVEEKDQWIDVRLIDTATGAVLDATYEREGGGVFDPTGRYYYHGDNNSSGSEFHRFDTEGDNFVELAAVRTTGFSYYGSRTVKRSADGTCYYWNGTAFDAQLNVLWTTNEEIQSASLHGDAVFTPGEVRNGATGAVIASLPVSTSIMTIGGNQENLFLASGGNLTVVDLSTILDLPGPGMQPAIVDGSTVIGVDQTLRWSLDPFASAYKVYFGTSLAAVVAASETSPEFLGTVTGGEVSLPSELVLGGKYFWRVDTTGFLGATTGLVWSFEVAPVEIQPSRLSISIPSGLQTTREFQLSSVAPMTWTASVAPSGPLVLDDVSGITPGMVGLTVNVAGMGVGTHQHSINFVAGGKTFAVPVEIEVLSLNYTHLEADGQLPYVYGISQISESSTSPAHLLRIDAATGQVLDAVPVGSSVSDLEIHYPENRIYVTNWMTGKLRALDRTTLEEVQVYPFTPFGGTGNGVGDVYRISAGKAGRLVVEEKDQWVDLSLMDTATGAVLDTIYEREGGGTTDPTGRYYYHGDNNSSGSEFHRFDTNGDDFFELGAVRTTGVSYYGGRTVRRSADGTRYYWNGTAFDTQLNVLWTINEDIQAVSQHGDAVFTPGEIRNGSTGAVIASLPVSTSTMAISGSQRNLFLASGPSLTMVDLSTLIDLPGAGILPTVADGSTVIGVDQKLGWSLDPFASAYKVYFGTSLADVQAADEASGEYLGTVSGGELSLPWDLILGEQYFWRVDAVGFLGAVDGPTWSFEVAPIEIQPSRLSLSILAGLKATRQLDLSATTPMAWTAAVTPSGPLTLSENGGVTPDSLQVTVDTAGMTVGSHSHAVSFTAGGKNFTLPVEIEVLNLNYTHLEADGQLPYVYGITQVSESSISPAHLLRIDAATGQVLDAVPVGSSVSDLEVHYQENRIYVTNWMTGKLRALDRTTLEEVQVYSFQPFANGVGGDVYRISAGKAGRLVVEEKDQWIDVNLLNTATGTVLDTSYEREGGGIFDPTGRYYYHGDNNSSGAEFHRFDTDGDNFVELNAVRTIGVSYYGSRTVKRTADGTRYYWNGTAHDAQLNVLWTTNDEIHGASLHGDAVFTPGEVRNGATGAVIASLPSSTSIMALAGDQQNLFLASGSILTVVDLSEILELPGAGIQPSLVDGSTVIGVDQALGWSLDPFASAYKVYFGTSLADVQAADEASPQYLGVVNGGELSLPWDLALGGRYFWRVDAIGFLGSVAGPVWSFEVAPIEIHPARLSISLPSGLSTSRELVLSATAPVAWSASVASSGVLELNEAAGTAPSTVSIAVDVEGLAVGAHARSITFSAGGKTFVVPVDIEVLKLNYTHLEADAQLPYVYGISQVSESSTSPAYLLRIDAATGAVLDSVPVGSSVSDLEVHYAENRIYVTNWMTGKLRALDRTTLEEVRVYPFVPYGGTGSSGGDVYRIAAGKAGRLILEEKDQWIDVALFNTNSGVIIRKANVREGGGTSDPSGRYYYHGDNNISDASLRRFDTEGDNLNLLFSFRTVGLSYYGDRKVVMSGDGSRVFWNGTAHDAQLNVLWTGIRRIDAVTANGRVVFTSGRALSGTTGAEIANLPVTTSVMAVGFDQEKLFLASGSTLTTVNLGNLILPPGEEIVPTISNGSTVVGEDQALSWSAAPRAETYKVFIGQSQAQVSSADESSPEYLGEVALNSIDLLGLIDSGETYFWRVDAVGALETIRGEIWSFGVDPVVLQPDVMVGLSSGSSLGDDHYNEVGANQTVFTKLKGKRAGSIYFWSENDGNKVDHFSLTSSRGNRNLSVSYVRTSPSVENVTAAISLPGGAKLTNQAPGSKAGFQAIIRRAKTAKGKRSSLQLFFRVVSDDSGANDAAKGMINQSN